METMSSLVAAIAPKRIDDIRSYLDWEVWAPTRGNADGYTWYGIEATDTEGLAVIAQISLQSPVVRGEWTVLLSDGRSVLLFGIPRVQ